MKKIALLLLAVILISLTPLRADEGMWLLPLLEKLNQQKMKELGCKLEAKDIYNVNGTSLKDAVIHFGNGCTGEVISAEGLIITNHHCGYGAIQKLSSVEHDYLTDGYWAMSREQELPASGLTVTFLESFTDVTDKINNAMSNAATSEEKVNAMNNIIAQLKKEAIGNNNYLKANVVPMYAGNMYYLVVTKTFNDIRFVGAPPSSIGKFGADTDNWMWPRHTGDFSMFRIYADKNNNPAPYSPENVPYQAKRHLNISIKGINHYDYAMIIGYPGRTNRFMTSAEVRQTSDISNAITIFARGLRQDILMKEMLADPKIRIQYASKYASSSNFWKKAIGMNETFKKNNVAERRAQEEEEFIKWVNADKSRLEKYGNALENINNAVAAREDIIYNYKYLTETLMNIEIAAIASQFSDVEKAFVNGDDATANTTAQNLREKAINFYNNYSPEVDKKVAKTFLKVFREKVSADNLPNFYSLIDEKFGGNIDEYVDYLYDQSVFTSIDKLYKAIEKGREAIVNDPAVIMGRSLFSLMNQLSLKLNRINSLYAEASKTYLAGLLEMNKGKAMYPDANSTMRLTYGKVLNYSPKDAVLYEHYTTLKGVMEKEDPNNWEFVVPAKLKELYNNSNYGPYAMKDGKLPVAFITNNDITGGNSGSPVLNAKGELIGLAFDGNWEAMSGDIIFEPNLQRCINVDIRYVLFIIDKFGGAGYLLNEMSIVK
jgi:hypothetical protein